MEESNISVIVISPQSFECKRIDTASLLPFLQTIVGGTITIIPHEQGYDAPYVAYANDEGLLLNLPPNGLATKTLAKLGFLDFQQEWGHPIFGSIVLLGQNETSLNPTDQTLIKNILQKEIK